MCGFQIVVMEYKGLVLDKFQVDAISSIENNHSVVVSAPTGSGKTLIADYIINKYMGNSAAVVFFVMVEFIAIIRPVFTCPCIVAVSKNGRPTKHVYNLVGLRI